MGWIAKSFGGLGLISAGGFFSQTPAMITGIKAGMAANAGVASMWSTAFGTGMAGASNAIVGAFNIGAATATHLVSGLVGVVGATSGLGVMAMAFASLFGVGLFVGACFLAGKLAKMCIDRMRHHCPPCPPMPPQQQHAPAPSREQQQGYGQSFGTGQIGPPGRTPPPNAAEVVGQGAGRY